jgi:enoyl-CoA hydratase
MTGYQHIKYATQPSDYRHVKYEVADRIARITLNRPAHANVQSTILLEELDHAIDRAGADLDVRVIVLSGEGKNWSAGHDLGTPEEMEHSKDYPLEEGARSIFERS